MSRFVVSGGPPPLAWMTCTGNVIPPTVPRPWTVDADREGTTRGLSNVRSQQTCDVTRPLGGRRNANPVRVSVAGELGRDIDGAWWPRADRITNELPRLVGVLTPLLGQITAINVNWPPLQRPPDFNRAGWEQKRQHVMTLNGEDACANLLVIPYATHTALALMVLRCAANLPIKIADLDKPAFATADSILRAAQLQRTPVSH